MLFVTKPGASNPVLWVSSNAMIFVATTILAVGVVAASRRIPALRRTLSGTLARGAIGLTVLHAFQWLSLKYVDVIAYQHGSHETLLAPLLHPYGVSHAFGYGVLVGTAVALFGRAFARTDVTSRFVDWAGMAAGALVAVTAFGGLMSVVVVGDSMVFVPIVLLYPLLYVWIFAVGISLFRQRQSRAFHTT